MSKITINTGSVTRQFGSFSSTIEFDIDDASNVTTTMKMAKMPTLSQDFDLQEEAENVTDFKMNTSKVSLEIFDELGNEDSLFERIEALGNDDKIKIKIVVGSGTDYFISTKQQCEYDWRARKIKIKGQSGYRYSVFLPQEIASETFSIDDFLINEVGDTRYAPVKSVVRAFLDGQGDDPTTVVIGSAFDVDVDDVDPVTTPTFIGVEEQYINTYSAVERKALRMAIAESAMIGTMLGYSFYVRRNYDGTATFDTFSPKADISGSDLKSFGMKFFNRNVKDFFLQISFTDQFGTAVASQTFTIFPRGTQDFNITCPTVINLTTLDYDSGTTDWEPRATGGGNVTALPNVSNIFDDTSDSYKRALQMEQSFSVDFEIFGVNTLKPFQYLNLASSGIHPAINGKKIRPTQLEYNLEDDTVKGKGYIIG